MLCDRNGSRIAVPDGPGTRAGRDTRFYAIGVVGLLASVLPWFTSLLAHWIWGNAPHVQQPLHQFFELIGSCIAVGVALLLLLRVSHEAGAGHLVWAAAALVSMGVIDAVHAEVAAEAPWSWLRHSATLVGGLLLGLIWIPLPETFVRRKSLFVLALGATASAIAFGIWWNSGYLPAPWTGSEYNLGVRVANAAGGLGFLSAAIFFLRQYLQQRRNEDLVFACHALLFATAGVLFGFSHRWAADWWVWHIFRLLAYGVILIAAYQMVATLYHRLERHARELSATVEARTAELRRSEEQFRLASQATDDVIWDWDLATDRVDWNGAVLTSLGTSIEELGHAPDSWYSRIHPDDRDRVAKSIKQAMQGGDERWTSEYRFQRKDGSYGTFLDRGLIARDQTGKTYRMVGSMINVTLQRQSQEALQRALEESQKRAAEAEEGRRLLADAKAAAENASRAKDHFLAALSHELRTPLTPAIMAVTLLAKDPQLPERYRQDLEMIRRNMELEARLIDDLLDVSRIVQGKVELDQHPIELGEVIHRAVAVCQPDIEARGLRLDVDLGPEAPYRINADPGRLQQVFWNLLKNAIKFTPPGGSVGLRCRRDADQSVIVEVVDSGEGIEPSLLPRLFRPFEQGGPEVTRQFGGLGLGLTITRSLVEMHGGSISAHSDGKGKGASFRVRLPLYALAASTQPAVSGSPAVSRPNAAELPGNLCILLVEDHLDTARTMRRLLTLDGHRVELAGDVATALALASAHHFDLLISDLGLPDGNGVQLMETLRERGCDMPGIALSGYGQQRDLQRTSEAGFLAHLTKPVSVDRLSAAIANVTSKSAAPHS